MKLLGVKILDEFQRKHADAKSQIAAFKAEVTETHWADPRALKKDFPKASILANEFVVFDICGNKYRLLVQMNYKNGIMFAEKIGTHAEYDRWNLK